MTHPEVWYRLELRRYAAPLDEFDAPMGRGHLEISHRTYDVLRTTPKGVWLNGPQGPRFVLRDARKRFACPTLEEAQASFLARQRRRAGILRNQLEEAEWAIARMEPASALRLLVNPA